MMFEPLGDAVINISCVNFKIVEEENILESIFSFLPRIYESDLNTREHLFRKDRKLCFIIFIEVVNKTDKS